MARNLHDAWWGLVDRVYRYFCPKAGLQPPLVVLIGVTKKEDLLSPYDIEIPSWSSPFDSRLLLSDAEKEVVLANIAAEIERLRQQRSRRRDSGAEGECHDPA